ncbi:hypothetical protein [Tropicibacter naphthalenivorans]|uniref:Uncharacterized protein n=1 Tax=Tropicibacter naphthalenivorans TaxID=441103 RepID=A0A0P1GFG4_9RHOB|nr:hypothetical protein [Tropicibacter naphthalenivorans]CUH80119.1 hypothetical protein TRN7648_02828 [Tropicibacter naphthalenivorans]SMC84752.1 hypothetical protein SAMN04488093_10597 [Tropicibacter naphthalenivorans]
MRRLVLIVTLAGIALMAWKSDRLWPLRAPLYDALYAGRDIQSPALPIGLTTAYALIDRPASGLWSEYCHIRLWKLGPKAQARLEADGLDFLMSLNLASATPWTKDAPDLDNRRGHTCPGRGARAQATSLVQRFSQSPGYHLDTGRESGSYYAILPAEGLVLRLDSGD